ncbi:MAG TPA: hypothetical protein VMU81_24595 [Acetobacteraceae bacterium]|nr:hypothetical protein [Acetobacteraceae bacterium]
MATSSGSGTGFALCGSPQRLVLTGELPRAPVRIVLSDELAAWSDRPVHAIATRDRHRRPPLIRLGPFTPPGIYQATLESDGQRHPVTVTVAPAPMLSADPSGLLFAGPPGSGVTAHIALCNRGNTGVTIPTRAKVGLYDDDGLEFAFADTYRQKQSDPANLVGNWLQRLREGYGGLLRLDIVQGAGALEPGAARMLEVQATLPEQARARHAYHGIWSVGSLNCLVEVSVDRQPGSGGAIQ